MPKRRPSSDIPHRAIVNSQQELLKWCPNVEGVLKNDLKYVCWACGRRSKEKLTRCHIDQYLPERPDQPSNFILLCDRCHREQPDALPKEALKYWLSTRESETEYWERRKAVFDAASALLTKEFGDLVVRLAYTELEQAGDIKSVMKRYGQNSAGQGSGNVEANMLWGYFAEIHKWCVANKEAVELEAQEIERKMDAVPDSRRPLGENWD